MMARDIFDLVFVLSAIAFNLLIACILVAEERGRVDLRRKFGALWLCLAVPLAIVFFNDLIIGREPWIMICFGLIFLYMLVEWLLDYVWKFEFRNKLSLHVPYIMLEYLALFSLIAISFSIDRTWGWLVSISFWVLMASLIYLYAPRPRKKV
jgi:hypothetical protein